MSLSQALSRVYNGTTAEGRCAVSHSGRWLRHLELYGETRDSARPPRESLDKESRTMRRHFVSVFAVATLAAIPVSAQSMADAEARAARAGHTPVSSDGTPVEVGAAEAGLRSVDSFEGFAPELMADDAHAEFAGGEITAEEVWAVVQREARVAPMGRESIIGADTRVRINPTTGIPYRQVVWITFSQDGSNYSCSGNLINANTVLTAGHCVHEGFGGSWSTNVRVYPGRNGSLSPYGSCTAKRLYSVTGWTNSGNEAYDYGAIKLNCNIGNTVGWFGFYWRSGSLNGYGATIAGYPGDKPSGQQWRSTGTVAATQTLQTFYKNDTFGGMSGSGVYSTNQGNCSGHCIHTVHAYGLHGGSPHSTNNHGTRITQSVFNNLIAWRNAS
jgi:glutamyl endopeptidase